MKKLFPAVLLTALFIGAVVRADGNDPSGTTGGTTVYVAASQAATVCVESNVAAGSATSTTIPAVAGQYFYITSVTSMLNAIAAPVATLYPTTSSNVPGSFSVRQAVQAAVGNFDHNEIFAVPLKTSVVGTPTVFTGTALANVSAMFRVCGFYAK